MPEKRRKSRFFKIKKEEPEEEEAEEEEAEELEKETAEELVKETLEEEEAKAPEAEEKPEEPEELEKETAEELVKETLEEEEAKAPEAEEKPEEPERLRPPLPTPRKPDVLRQVKEDIYRLKGALKTLKGKLDRKEISQEEYEEKSKKLKLMLANLYEKKIKRELGI